MKHLPIIVILLLSLKVFGQTQLTNHQNLVLKNDYKLIQNKGGIYALLTDGNLINIYKLDSNFNRFEKYDSLAVRGNSLQSTYYDDDVLMILGYKKIVTYYFKTKKLESHNLDKFIPFYGQIYALSDRYIITYNASKLGYYVLKDNVFELFEYEYILDVKKDHYLTRNYNEDRHNIIETTGNAFTLIGLNSRIISSIKYQNSYLLRTENKIIKFDSSTETQTIKNTTYCNNFERIIDQDYAIIKCKNSFSIYKDNFDKPIFESQNIPSGISRIKILKDYIVATSNNKIYLINKITGEIKFESNYKFDYKLNNEKLLFSTDTALNILSFDDFHITKVNNPHIGVTSNCLSDTFVIFRSSQNGLHKMDFNQNKTSIIEIDNAFNLGVSARAFNSLNSGLHYIINNEMLIKVNAQDIDTITNQELINVFHFDTKDIVYIRKNNQYQFFEFADGEFNYLTYFNFPEEVHINAYENHAILSFEFSTLYFHYDSPNMLHFFDSHRYVGRIKDSIYYIEDIDSTYSLIKVHKDNIVKYPIIYNENLKIFIDKIYAIDENLMVFDPKLGVFQPTEIYIGVENKDIYLNTYDEFGIIGINNGPNYTQLYFDEEGIIQTFDNLDFTILNISSDNVVFSEDINSNGINVRQIVDLNFKTKRYQKYPYDNQASYVDFTHYKGQLYVIKHLELLTLLGTLDPIAGFVKLSEIGGEIQPRFINGFNKVICISDFDGLYIVEQGQNIRKIDIPIVKSLHLDDNDLWYVGQTPYNGKQLFYLNTSIVASTESTPIHQNAPLLYPNPASVHIDIAHDLPFDTYSIYDLKGSHIISGKAAPIDISSLHKGTYIIIIHSDTLRHYQLFTKM